MAVLSNKIYTAQEYVETLTDKYYIFHSGDAVIEQIEDYLADNNIYDLWNYPLNEIDHIIEDGLDVVLVDVTDIGDNGELVNEYRWFEVPQDSLEMF